MKLVERFRRIRTGKGFGVHSPFAFWLLTEVIRGRYAYYGYEEIEEALEQHPEEGVLRGHCRLLLRLAGRMGAAMAILPDGTPAAVKAAVKGAGRRIRILSPRASLRGAQRLLLWSEGELPQGNALPAVLSREGSLIVVLRPGQGVKEELWEAMGGGVLIDGGSVLIGVVKKDIRKACYEILL